MRVRGLKGCLKGKVQSDALDRVYRASKVISWVSTCETPSMAFSFSMNSCRTEGTRSAWWASQRAKANALSQRSTAQGVRHDQHSNTRLQAQAASRGI